MRVEPSAELLNLLMEMMVLLDHQHGFTRKIPTTDAHFLGKSMLGGHHEFDHLNSRAI
jgi:hypothetical protein